MFGRIDAKRSKGNRINYPVRVHGLMRHLHMSSRLSMTAGVHRPPRHPQLLGRHPDRSDRSTRPGLSPLLDHPASTSRVRSNSPHSKKLQRNKPHSDLKSSARMAAADTTSMLRLVGDEENACEVHKSERGMYNTHHLVGSQFIPPSTPPPPSIRSLAARTCQNKSQLYNSLLNTEKDNCFYAKCYTSVYHKTQMEVLEGFSKMLTQQIISSKLAKA